jgi:hypothetical protein
MAVCSLLSAGCDDPVADDDMINDDDDDGGGDDDDNDELVFTFSVAAPIELEQVWLDGDECKMEDGIGLCEIDDGHEYELWASVQNHLFVEMTAQVVREEVSFLLVDDDKVCDFNGAGEGCTFEAWTEPRQYCLAPNGEYRSSVDGSSAFVGTDDVDGECHISFSVCEFPVDYNQFSGVCDEANVVDIGTISDDLQEIYYHMIMWDGSEFEETLTLD